MTASGRTELDPRDLEELQELADRHIEALQASGASITGPEDITIYGQCGDQPSWQTFEEYWNSI